MEKEIDRIIKATALRFGVTLSEIRSKSRRRRFVTARNVGMYVARAHTGATFEQIGSEFGGRHTSTVQHAINSVKADRRLIEQAKTVAEALQR